MLYLGTYPDIRDCMYAIKRTYKSMKLTFTEFANQIANGIDDATLQIAEVAKNFYCSIYNDTPAWVLRGNRLVSPVARRALESACAPNLPPPPPPVVEGEGQCGVEYQLRGKGIYQGSDILGYVCNTEITWGASGTFEGYYLGHTVSNFDKGQNAAVTVTYRDLAGEQQTQQYVIRSNDGNVGSGVLVWNDTCSLINNKLGIKNLNSIIPVRTDGLPDNCVTPPGYTEVPPPTPDDLNVDIDITTTYGDVVTYNVTINPDSDGYPSFPPVINVSGISVDIDALGIGIGEVNIGTPSGGGGGLGSPDGGDTTGDDSSESQDGDEDVTETPPEEITEGEEKTVDNLVALRVEVVSMPSNAKVVFGNGGADIIYAGWVSFVKDGALYPREWIDHKVNYYEAPEGNTGYSITNKIGFTLSVVEIRKDVPVE